MNKTRCVYWATMQHNSLRFHLGATENGLCCITLPNESFDTLRQWVNKRIHQPKLIEDAEKLLPYTIQLSEYFIGIRQKFTVPLDLRGTEFQKQVWLTLFRIPYGETWSYSKLATHVGRPKAVRAVGAANGANPIPIIIPCHRVVGKNGKLTGYRGGLDLKAALLRLEGIAHVSPLIAPSRPEARHPLGQSNHCVFQ